jgi:hypothetical protein
MDEIARDLVRRATSTQAGDAKMKGNGKDMKPLAIMLVIFIVIIIALSRFWYPSTIPRPPNPL